MTAHATPRSGPLEPAGDGSPWRVVRIPAELRLEGAGRLVGRAAASAGVDGLEAARRFLVSTINHGIDLTHFWGSVEDAPGQGELGLRVRQAVLAVPSRPGTGRTAMAFTSQPGSEEEQAEVAAVLDRASRNLPGVRIVQGLLEPEETGALGAFRKAAFIGVGDLLYLRRSWAPPGPIPPGGWPEGVEVANWRPGDDPAVLEALDRSYAQTLDCPELCGLRDTRDVLDSHRSAGRFDPALWWIVRKGGCPSGALLMNPAPAQGNVELVYLGLAPELRGSGVARRLLSTGLHALAGRDERDVTLAVDTRNAPALRLYESQGFRPFARRTALVRPVDAQPVDTAPRAAE